MLAMDWPLPKQWMDELSSQGLNGPVMHTALTEPNQLNNFLVLSDVLRMFGFLCWLKNKNSRHPRLASFFEDDTRVASMFGERNLWHSHYTIFSDQHNFHWAELCGCQGDPFNSQREGRRIVLSLSTYLKDIVHDGLIAYMCMCDGQEKAKERIQSYSKFNNYVCSQYKLYGAHCLVLTMGLCTTLVFSCPGLKHHISEPFSSNFLF